MKICRFDCTFGQKNKEEQIRFIGPRGTSIPMQLKVPASADRKDDKDGV
jgi:hypothetical protein